MTLAFQNTQHYNYGDYVTWSDDAQCELIDGEAFMMSPAPDLAHQEVAGEIYFQIRQALQGNPCRAFMAPIDVRLPKQNEADDQIDTVVQPDLFVVCNSNKLDKRGVRGAPDWIIEVLSPSTASRDQITKRNLYERHGVFEYWLVHPVDRMLTIYHLENGEYHKPVLTKLEGQTSVKILPEIVIRWDELMERLPKGY